MNTKLVIDKGRLNCSYPGESRRQPIVADIYADGTVYVHYNPEIGSAVPEAVYAGRTRRVNIMVRTREDARTWYRTMKPYLIRLCRGMFELWDGHNVVGALTDDARSALETIETDAFNTYYSKY